jgi:hypothetical protein
MNRIALPLRIAAVMLFFAWALAVGLMSCTTPKKVQKRIYKSVNTLKKYGALDSTCATEYPIRESIVYRDSVHFDTLYTEGLHLIDTVYLDGKPIVIHRQCPDAQVVTKYVTKEVTKIQENTARVSMLQGNIEQLEGISEGKDKDIAVLKDRLGEAKKSRNWWMIACLITWAIVALYVVLKMRTKLPI